MEELARTSPEIDCEGVVLFTFLIPPMERGPDFPLTASWAALSLAAL